jgi:hypothetical protein
MFSEAAMQDNIACTHSWLCKAKQESCNKKITDLDMSMQQRQALA